MAKNEPTKQRAVSEGKALLDDIFLNEGEQALEGMTRRCESELGHKPSLLDFKNLVEVLLGGELDRYFADCETVDLVELVLKTRKKPRSQRYQAGDVFAIPLGDGANAFGRILRLHSSLGMIVEVFGETSKRRRYRASILQSGRLFHPLVVNDLGSLQPWRWTVVHSDPGYRLSEADARLEFRAMPIPGRGWTATDPLADARSYRPITEAEWRAMESSALLGPEDVEEMIRAALKRSAR